MFRQILSSFLPGFVRWLPEISTAIITCAVCWLIGSHIIDGMEKAQAVAIENQKTADAAQCTKEKAVTTEVSHDYQTNLAALNAQLAQLKRMRENGRCVPIIRSTTGHDAAKGNTKSAN